MTRPRLSQNVLSRPLSPPPSYQPVLTTRRHPLSLPGNTRAFILFGSRGAYTQEAGLPRLPGQAGFVGDPVLHSSATSSQPIEEDTPFEHQPTYDDGELILPLPHPLNTQPSLSRNARKKARQWKRWQDDVLPRLVEPYLHLLSITSSLSRLQPLPFPGCRCKPSPQIIQPVALSFTVLRKISLQICHQCLPPIAEQLVAAGLFPCAPLLPSLVVDIRVLDLAMRLFLHMPPNNSAWCKAVEEFLFSLGFGLHGEDNLRRPFENALRWFSTLKHLTSSTVSSHLESIRPSLCVDVDRLNNSMAQLPTSNLSVNSPTNLSTGPTIGLEEMTQPEQDMRSPCMGQEIHTLAQSSLASGRDQFEIPSNDTPSPSPSRIPVSRRLTPQIGSVTHYLPVSSSGSTLRTQSYPTTPGDGAISASSSNLSMNADASLKVQHKSRIPVSKRQGTKPWQGTIQPLVSLSSTTPSLSSQPSSRSGSSIPTMSQAPSKPLPPGASSQENQSNNPGLRTSQGQVDTQVDMHSKNSSRVNERATLSVERNLPVRPSQLVTQPPNPSRPTSTSPIAPTASRKRTRTDSVGSSSSPPKPSFSPPIDRNRPSEYLRQRCPLCFGGEFPSKVDMLVDAIVCIDACFTQKRNKTKGPRDPERTHPDTVFIPECDLLKMQEFVEGIRKSPKEKAPQNKRQRSTQAESVKDDDDRCEENLTVPNSVLNGCEASFTAADERREKASTQFFDDTALMALLCRHDRVLWIANMRSAGEKQHYALALLEMLFQHLPLSFRIGLLYDIGCQLHRSCVLWGFLKAYLDRIVFGISVFHAFGHQWPCQLIYHPRKREGFGLSDGEGCERFWHSISKLIPVLRVSGYHQRLYTLDSQVHHLDFANLQRLGVWLHRRIQHCREKRAEAEKTLKECKQPESLLRDQWRAQIEAQTQPMPRQSKTRGRTAVEEVIRLRTAYDTQKRQVQDLERQLHADTEGYVHALASVEIQTARQALKRAETQLLIKERTLGVGEKKELTRLINDPYITLRMNALALKIRLRERLRARKFELDPVERKARKFTPNHEKLVTQTESSIQRRDPTIKQVARAYNKICDDIEKLVKRRNKHERPVCPSKISMEGLFDLDVDDDIWQDAGLSDEGVGMPPLWLSDENVRKGMRAMLERDRCVEEEARLVHERRAMQVWFSEEWVVVNQAIIGSDNRNLHYAFEQRKKELCILQVLWGDSISRLSLELLSLSSLPPWGPSDEEHLVARVQYFTLSVDHSHLILEDMDAALDDVEDRGNGSQNVDDDDDDDEERDILFSILDIITAAYPTHLLEDDGEVFEL